MDRLVNKKLKNVTSVILSTDSSTAGRPRYEGRMPDDTRSRRKREEREAIRRAKREMERQQYFEEFGMYPEEVKQYEQMRLEREYYDSRGVQRGPFVAPMSQQEQYYQDTSYGGDPRSELPNSEYGQQYSQPRLEPNFRQAKAPPQGYPDQYRSAPGRVMHQGQERRGYDGYAEYQDGGGHEVYYDGYYDSGMSNDSNVRDDGYYHHGYTDYDPGDPYEQEEQYNEDEAYYDEPYHNERRDYNDGNRYEEAIETDVRDDSGEFEFPKFQEVVEPQRIQPRGHGMPQRAQAISGRTPPTQVQKRAQRKKQAPKPKKSLMKKVSKPKKSPKKQVLKPKTSPKNQPMLQKQHGNRNPSTETKPVLPNLQKESRNPVTKAPPTKIKPLRSSIREVETSPKPITPKQMPVQDRIPISESTAPPISSRAPVSEQVSDGVARKAGRSRPLPSKSGGRPQSENTSNLPEAQTLPPGGGNTARRRPISQSVDVPVKNDHKVVATPPPTKLPRLRP